MAIPVINQNEEELFKKHNWHIVGSLLQDFIKDRRWFRSKARDIQSVKVVDVVQMNLTGSCARMVLIQVEYVTGNPEIYVVPLIAGDRMDGDCIVRLQLPQQPEKLVCDAMTDNNFCSDLLQAIARNKTFNGESGLIIASSTRIFESLRGNDTTALVPLPAKVEQSNTSVFYGKRLILKLFRQPGEGTNPELEIGRFLTEKTSFKNMSPMAGDIEYHQSGGGPVSLAVLQGFVPNEGDAWKYTLKSLQLYFENTSELQNTERYFSAKHPISLINNSFNGEIRHNLGSYLDSADLLGRRTAELHLALSSESENPDFSPEPFSMTYQNTLVQQMQSLTEENFKQLRQRLDKLSPDIKKDALKLLEIENSVLQQFELINDTVLTASRIRCHGDYHLGQILFTGSDFVIIDFEGEPARPLAQRRLKRSPLLDVAGLMRSFHYAVYTAMQQHSSFSNTNKNNQSPLQRWALAWYTWISASFLTSYLNTIEKSRLLPQELDQIKVLLDAHILEKAIYEIGYELNNRPDWLSIPLLGVLQLMETSDA